MNALSGYLLGLAALVLAFWVFVLLPADMARAWLPVSLFVSPFMAILPLAILGRSPRTHPD